MIYLEYKNKDVCFEMPYLSTYNLQFNPKVNNVMAKYNFSFKNMRFDTEEEIKMWFTAYFMIKLKRYLGIDNANNLIKCSIHERITTIFKDRHLGDFSNINSSEKFKVILDNKLFKKDGKKYLMFKTYSVALYGDKNTSSEYEKRMKYILQKLDE